VSLQKGIIDLIEAAQMLKDKVHFRVVGNVVPDAASRVAAARDCIRVPAPCAGAGTARHLQRGGCVCVSTLHDGFAAVLAQARAGCLPIVATDHCAAPDMLTNGETGWVIPTRDAREMAARLTRLNEDRQLAAGMVEISWQRCDTRDWSDVGKDFLKAYRQGTPGTGLDRPDPPERTSSPLNDLSWTSCPIPLRPGS